MSSHNGMNQFEQYLQELNPGSDYDQRNSSIKTYTPRNDVLAWLTFSADRLLDAFGLISFASSALCCTAEGLVESKDVAAIPSVPYVSNESSLLLVGVILWHCNFGNFCVRTVCTIFVIVAALYGLALQLMRSFVAKQHQLFKWKSWQTLRCLKKVQLNRGLSSIHSLDDIERFPSLVHFNLTYRQQKRQFKEVLLQLQGRRADDEESSTGDLVTIADLTILWKDIFDGDSMVLPLYKSVEKLTTLVECGTVAMRLLYARKALRSIWPFQDAESTLDIDMSLLSSIQRNRICNDSLHARLEGIDLLARDLMHVSTSPSCLPLSVALVQATAEFSNHVDQQQQLARRLIEEVDSCISNLGNKVSTLQLNEQDISRWKEVLTMLSSGDAHIQTLNLEEFTEIPHPSEHHLERNEPSEWVSKHDASTSVHNVSAASNDEENVEEVFVATTTLRDDPAAHHRRKSAEHPVPSAALLLVRELQDALLHRKQDESQKRVRVRDFDTAEVTNSVSIGSMTSEAGLHQIQSDQLQTRANFASILCGHVQQQTQTPSVHDLE